MSAPKVSVIVPNYNHARFLRQRIDTILAQTFQDFELIFLDDCSTDDSRSILSSYASDPRVRLLFNEHNSGNTFMQWNKGVGLARGEYIWIAESDDYADPNLLERLLPLLEDEKTAFAYCRSRRVTQDGQLDGFGDDYLLPVSQDRWSTSYRANGPQECRNYFACANIVPNASSVLFRKAFYQHVGGADESFNLCGDWKLWAAMALAGDIAYLAEPLNYFRTHKNTVRSRTLESNGQVAEALRVIGWVFRNADPPADVRHKVCVVQSEKWVPVVMSRHVPLDLRRTMLRYARDIDPHPFWRAIRPGLATIRFKFLRHWRELSASASSRLLR
jgi:hypothetical protein